MTTAACWWIKHHPQGNHYPLDGVVCFANIYPQDGDLSGDQCYTEFGKLGPVCYFGGYFLAILVQLGLR